MNNEQLSKLFDEIDKDHSGYIDKDELTEILYSSGLGTKQIDSFVAIADVNGDGKISREEFAILWKVSHGVSVTNDENINNDSIITGNKPLAAVLKQSENESPGEDSPGFKGKKKKKLRKKKKRNASRKFSP